MSVVTDIERHQRPQRVRHIGETEDRHLGNIFSDFAAPKDAVRKIVLVRPFSVLSKTTYSAAILPPLGLAYLASTVRKAGYPVDILDAQGEDIFNCRRSSCGRYNLQGMDAERLAEKIDLDALVVGVSLMFSQEWIPQRDFIKQIRKRLPDAVIVAGGEHPSALPEYVLRDCPEIDFVVRGEAELTFLELVHRIFHAGDTQDAPGVSFIRADGTFVSNGNSNRITYIDELPRPAWDLCKVDSYFQPNWAMGINMGRHMPILATRGCPYQCTFCSNPMMWTTRYKMRDPVDVADEIEHLVKDYGVNSVDFFDLTAIVKKDWTLAFCDELKRRKLEITWQLPSGTRSEALDQETLTALFDTGCRLITYAPESGSEKTLSQIKKMLKLPRVTESIRMAKGIGHNVKINLIIGFPDERLSDVLKTTWYALKMAFWGADDCNIATFSPYPGSELYDRLRKENKLPAPNDDYIVSLLVQFDFLRSESYCERIGGRTMSVCRVIGYLLFYGTAYLFHPGRILRLAKNLTKPSFQPANVVEQRLFDLYVRNKQRSAA